VVRHILDSLAVLPWLQGPRVLDVGSGAGLPGIPLALAQPDGQFHLLDSNGKRSRFLRQAVAELPLDNVTVVHSRLADYRPAGHFDSILARAFGTLAELAAGAIHLCAPGGRLLAMKGTYPDAELIHLPATCRLVSVYPLRVPHLAAERHLVHLVPTESPTRADSN
jgi:16S rRNA (guanine527-N7)-methyltransferase